ncbi:MAG: NUDIX hydrolase [Verrucomicrobiota bacterium]
MSRDLSAKPWDIISSKPLIHSRWFSLREDVCQRHDGVTISPYYVAECPHWVHVALFNKDHEILVIRQYRHGIKKFVLELPGGMMELKEKPLDAAKRELAEETGYQARHFHSLPTVSPDPARLTNFIHSYIATEIITSSTQKLDPSEEIELAFLPVDTIINEICKGSFLNACHIGIFYLALSHLNQCSTK